MKLSSGLDAKTSSGGTELGGELDTVLEESARCALATRCRAIAHNVTLVGKCVPVRSCSDRPCFQPNQQSSGDAVRNADDETRTQHGERDSLPRSSQFERGGLARHTQGRSTPTRLLPANRALVPARTPWVGGACSDEIDLSS